MRCLANVYPEASARIELLISRINASAGTLDSLPPHVINLVFAGANNIMTTVGERMDEVATLLNAVLGKREHERGAVDDALRRAVEKTSRELLSMRRIVCDYMRVKETEYFTRDQLRLSLMRLNFLESFRVRSDDPDFTVSRVLLSMLMDTYTRMCEADQRMRQTEAFAADTAGRSDAVIGSLMRGLLNVHMDPLGDVLRESYVGAADATAYGVLSAEDAVSRSTAQELGQLKVDVMAARDFLSDIHNKMGAIIVAAKAEKLTKRDVIDLFSAERDSVRSVLARLDANDAPF